MKVINRNYIVATVLSTTILFSCVPARKFEEEKSKRTTCETDLTSTKTSLQECETQRAEMKDKIADIEKRLTGLRADTTVLGTSARLKTSQYAQLMANYELLDAQVRRMRAEEQAQNTRLVGQLQMTQEELIKKQDELKLLEKDLMMQKQNLEALKAELTIREKRVNELESLIKSKDQAVADLKKKVTDALLGFENKGLTITQKNGKIYVSMDETLLFASGSTQVEPKGQEALKKLAKVLEQNSDINIMVEGHTDDQPMKGSGQIKDNWDLSVMRATSVVKIIMGGSSIDPKRITAAGRGEFFPLDPGKNSEARKKNRRTEVILTPKLDELFKVLESN